MRNEKGGLLLEFALFFPVVALTFFIFILTGVIITQRAVLDRAVAHATTEAAAWLSTDMHMVGRPVAFRGTSDNFRIRANPYDNLIGNRCNCNPRCESLFGSCVYAPMNRNSFNRRVIGLVQQHARYSIAGRFAADNIAVDVRRCKIILWRLI